MKTKYNYSIYMSSLVCVYVIIELSNNNLLVILNIPNPHKFKRNNLTIKRLSRFNKGTITEYYNQSQENPSPTLTISTNELLNFLKKYKPDEQARKLIFKEFGDKIFGLTKIEKEYFQSNFKNIKRLKSFYSSVSKELAEFDGDGYVHRDFNNKSIMITKTKIRKAARELFKEELFP